MSIEVQGGAIAEEDVTLLRLGECLVDEKQPIAKRTRAVFHLKRIGGKPAIDTLAKVLHDPSVLLSHEVAYALGQMCDPYAIPVLTATLEDKSVHAVTRHEAAEALGAISSEESLPVLEAHLKDGAHEVVHTCTLAVDRIKWVLENKARAEANQKASVYYSIDPAPAYDAKDGDRVDFKSVDALKSILLDEECALFDRYRAMFTLRNMNSEESVLALAESFADSSSALFRHEVAYVFGQMQHPAAVRALTRVLDNRNEHCMVRHEAAEALGSIAHEDCPVVLRRNLDDSELIVRQSCEVALDLADYWKPTASAEH